MTDENNDVQTEEIYTPEYPSEALVLSAYPHARWIVGCELENHAVRVFYIIDDGSADPFIGEGPTLEAAWNSAAERVNLNRPTNATEAQLAAQEQYQSDVEKGKLLLDRLPPNPTYADLREAIWNDHAKLLASVEQHPSLNKGVHEAQ